MMELALVLAGIVTGMLPREALDEIRYRLLMPGVPLASLVVSELALRDGISQRTLLYAHLGPVSRQTQALVRTGITAGLLAIHMVVLVGVLSLVSGASVTVAGRHILAVRVGVMAYVTLGGLVYLYVRRGLVAGLLLYVLVDLPLGSLPFSMRNLVPSAHVLIVAGHAPALNVHGVIQTPDASWILSLGILGLFAAGAMVLTAYRFGRLDLSELC